MVEIKFPVRQIAIGIVLPAGITLIAMYIVKLAVFDTLFNIGGFFLAVLPSVGVFALILFFMYFPLTAVFGGWDATNLEEFRKVSAMSGPSKFIVVPIYKIVNAICKKSKMHGRFGMPVEGVIKDAQELLEIKLTNRAAFKERHKND